jgi:nucleoside phosphorylase
MSRNFPQAIVQRSSISQTGRLPAVMAQAEKPRQPATLAYEKLEGGQEVPPRVVILTALAKEFLAVENHLPDNYEVTHQDGTVYKCGRFTSCGSVWDVSIVETGQGNCKAANETQRAINHFKPNVVMFVGVAAGRKDVKIGDVVAADKVYNYESGRDGNDFKSRPQVEHSCYILEQHARAVTRDWLCRQKEPGNQDLPSAFVGAIALGESVVVSTESGTAQRLNQNYEDALAVEKEGYGFLRLRVKADQQLRQAFNEETCLLYLSTCLYAYSGNQMTVLELTPVEDNSHD